MYANGLMYYNDGLLDPDDTTICPDNAVVNHAILAVGYYIDTANEDNSYVIYKNSWGTDWGDDGYFKFKLKTA